MHPDPFTRNVSELLHGLPAARRDAVLTMTRRLRHYAALMEQAATVSHAVSEGACVDRIVRLIVEGAGRIGQYRAGAFIVMTDEHPTIAATYGEFAGTEGRRAPAELTATCVTRLGSSRLEFLNTTLGIDLPVQELYLVPVATPDTCVGTLALLDSDGESPDDRLLESYGSRVALAYLHAVRLSERRLIANHHR